MIARFRRLLAFLRRHKVLVLLLVLVLGLLGLGTYRAGCHYYVENHVRAADEAMVQGDFDDAVEHLAACLWIRPRSASLHLKMAQAQRWAGRFEEAASHLEKCRQRGGTTLEVAVERLLIKAQSEDPAEVEITLLERVRENPDAPESLEILAALAQGYLRTYHLDGAMYCLDQLLKRRPDDVVALLSRGSLYEIAGKDGKAGADYRRAVEVQPRHVEARCRLGSFLLRQGQPEEALQQYEQVRRQRRGEGQPLVLMGLARTCEQLGDLNRARQALDELLARNPHDGDALVERGKLALQCESPAEAEGWLRRAVADSPFAPQSHYLLAQCLRRLGQNDEAQEHEAAQVRIKSDIKRLQAALDRVKKAPTDPVARREAGLLCLRAGREPEGERLLLSVLHIVPTDGPTRAALADYYARTGQLELAAQYRLPDQ